MFFFIVGKFLNWSSMACNEKMMDCTNARRATREDNFSSPVTFRWACLPSLLEQVLTSLITYRWLMTLCKNNSRILYQPSLVITQWKEKQLLKGLIILGPWSCRVDIRFVVILFNRNHQNYVTRLASFLKEVLTSLVTMWKK